MNYFIIQIQLITVLLLPQADLDRARKAIRGDWYDRQSETFVAPRLRELQDHPVRTNGRLAGPGWVWQPPRWNMGWFGSWVSYLMMMMVVLILLTCLVLLLLHFTRSYRPNERKRKNLTFEIDLARVEDLPFSVERMAGDPLVQARRLADAGQFDLAIIYLYGYQLLAMDQARRIHLQKGKTNRMYLRELAATAGLQPIVQGTMLKFEEVYFGKHSITSESFEESWGHLERFHQLLHREASGSSDPQPVSTVVAEATP